MSDPPKTSYAKSGDVHIAYQVLGDGPIDLVWVPGFVSNVEYDWEHPRPARFFRRLASFSRLIRFDKRGTGLSDRVGRAWAPDHPFGVTSERMQGILEAIERDWGSSVAMEIWSPSIANDESYKQWRATYLRLAASPGAAIAVMRMNMEIDVRHVLPVIGVPTLILHRSGDRLTPVEQARYLAEHIRGAKLAELPGVDHTPWVGDSDALLDEIEEFLTGIRHGAQADRILATVLFTDIVSSTKRAAELGDRGWSELLQQHDAIVRRELTRFRGREVNTTGDGFLITFDGPGRAIRCAASISRQVRSLGIEVRAGLHTGECETVGSTIGGIAVHIGSRVAAMANAGEILASSTVKDLVVGSGISFEDRGFHTLKGVPGEWRLFAVARAGEVIE